MIGFASTKEMTRGSYQTAAEHLFDLAGCGRFGQPLRGDTGAQRRAQGAGGENARTLSRKKNTSAPAQERKSAKDSEGEDWSQF